jgi:ribose/xylose/arabinose/galactoside ABC-type transport system permease subunit
MRMPGARDYSLRVLRHDNFALVIILAVLILVFGIATHGLSLKQTNILNIMLQSSMLGVAAVGQAFVIITAGLDLSIGGIALFVACLGGSPQESLHCLEKQLVEKPRNSHYGWYRKGGISIISSLTLTLDSFSGGRSSFYLTY